MKWPTRENIIESASHRPRPTSTGRVEAFSDGVFAIAITLLVLDLRPPQTGGRFLHDLVAEWQGYVAYLATFLIIGTIWLTHHSVFTRVARVDGPLLLANLAMLLFVAVLPFPTAVLSAAFRIGDRADQVAATIIYAGASIVGVLLWHLLTRRLERAPQLLHSMGDRAVIQKERRSQLAALGPPVIGIALAFASPVAALLLQAATPVVYLATITASRRSDVP